MLDSRAIFSLLAQLGITWPARCNVHIPDRQGLPHSHPWIAQAFSATLFPQLAHFLVRGRQLPFAGKRLLALLGEFLPPLPQQVGADPQALRRLADAILLLGYQFYRLDLELAAEHSPF